MNRSDPKQSVRELLEEAHPALIGLSHWIHANPEVGFEEHHASDWVNEWLQTAGFQVERGAADMPTALIGRFGSGPFHVAICVEYDALPEIGHACGHNVIAAAGVGAGLALASVADELGLRVSVMGTPAEESGGGKLRFIEAGHFEDVHAAVMVHPWPMDVATPDVIAITQLDVTYRGHEAHAAGFPHLGRNAADALVVAQTAIGLLRQQLLPSDRVHGIVTKGGDAPNIIPALTTARFMVRAQDSDRLDELTALVRRCFEAGALATGTEADIVEGTRYANMAHDGDLAAIYRHNAQQLGRVFDDAAGAPISTDMGDVSHVVPSIHPMIGIDSAGAVNHQREFTEACATPSADQAILDGALGLAWTVIDAAQNQVIRARLLGEAEIREAVAMVEEVQELDASADVLDDLAASMADADPELAERIAAAADALESHADELADAADSRFEHAQELADEALLEEFAGELESDVEDMVAAVKDAGLTVESVDDTGTTEDASDEELSTVVPVVELFAVVDLAEASDEGSGEVPDAWVPEATGESVEDGPEPEVTLVLAQVEHLEGLAAAEGTAGEAVIASAPVGQTALGEAEAEWQAQVADAQAASQEREAQPTAWDGAEIPVGQPVLVARTLGDDHAAWERGFLDTARHAAWEEQFSESLTTAEPAGEEAEPLDAVAEIEPSQDAEPLDAAAGSDAPSAEPHAEAIMAHEADPTWGQPVAESVEAIAQDEPVDDAADIGGWETAVEAVAEVEPSQDAEPLEAVAEVEPSQDAEPLEAVAEAEPSQDAEPLEAVAEAEPAVEADLGSDALVEALVEQAAAVADDGQAWGLATDADPTMAQDEPETFLTADDIWYSGAPDDELPAAELVTGEPVVVAATSDRSEGFVWIPADSEDR